MRVRMLIPILILSLALVGPAMSQELDTRWYVAPTGSYTFGSNDRHADDGEGFGLALGKVLNETLNLELGGRYEGLNLDAGADYQLTSVTLDGLLFFTRNNSFAPYLVVGAGVMRTEVLGITGEGLTGHAGLGFVSRLSDRIDLRADGRARWDDNVTDVYGAEGFGDWLVTLGLQIRLGAKPVAAPAPLAAPPAPVTPPKPAPVDSDGDGVTDDLDKCPGTPAGARVDANGCELDSDRDGVVDRLDKCPGTPAGRKVDANGCELDSDGDGVVDGVDQCPNTPKGDKVDAKGCTLLDITVLKGVNFDNDKSNLRPDALTILDESVAILKKYPTLKVEIAGHTDSNNTDKYNMALSHRRAKAVVDYFVSKGIEAARLTAKGYGESNPIADNKTADGRAENRRVEMRIVK